MGKRGSREAKQLSPSEAQAGLPGAWDRGTPTDSQVTLVVKNLPANAGDKRCGFNSWVRKTPWRRSWQPTAVFVPGESHEQRRLAGYGLQRCKESAMTEVTYAHTHIDSTGVIAGRGSDLDDQVVGRV